VLGRDRRDPSTEPEAPRYEQCVCALQSFTNSSMTKSCPLDRRGLIKRDEYREEANCAEVWQHIVDQHLARHSRN
jgi:hypothetical protein